MDTQDIASLASRARRERKRRGLTQEQVAEMAGVSLGTVSNFERMNGTTQPANLRAIMAALDLEQDAGDALADATRDGWPPDVRVFLDVVGVVLSDMSDERRAQVIHDLTKMVITTR